MPHIHTNPGEVDPTVTAYIVRLDGDEPQVLLHIHKKYNILLPVGGHIEVDETPWAALVREVEEEAGYKASDLRVLQPKHRIDHLQKNRINHPLPFLMNTHDVPNDIPHWHSDIAYCLSVNSAPTLEIDAAESQDLRWYTKQDIEHLHASGEIRQNKHDVVMFIFDTLLQEYDSIPALEYRTDKAEVDHT